MDFKLSRLETILEDLLADEDLTDEEQVRLGSVIMRVATTKGPKEPADANARVLDREGDEWARVGASWVCEHGGVPRTWAYLVSECAPLVVTP